MIVPESAMFLQLTPSAVLASSGDTVVFDAFLMRSDGTLTSKVAVQWTLSDSSKATLVRDGVVETAAPGDITVLAKSGPYAAEATVRVKEPAVGSVTISPAAANAYVGGMVRLSAELRDDRGKLLSGTIGDVQWSSSTPSVVTVNQDGVVRGMSRGGAIVTAKIGRSSASATVNVASPPAASVTLTLAPDTIAAGKTVQAVATPRDSSGNALTGKTIAWQSSNPSVATVNSSGLVTGVIGGATTISAIVDAKIASHKLTVSSQIPTSMSILPDPAKILMGGKTHMTAEVRDQLGNPMTGQAVSWSSLAANIATVSAAGDVTGVSLGSASIKATSGALSYTSTVAVVEVPVASVTVTPSSASLAVNATSTLVATAKDATGNVLSGRPVSWSSSNPTVASVSTSGGVTAIAAGVASITANIEGKTASASVNIASPPPAPVASVTVVTNSPSINPNQTTQATAHTYDAQGGELTGRTVSWSSANPTLASVSNTGLITAVAPGSVAIIGKSEGIDGAATLLIATSSPAPVSTVELSAAKTALDVGESAQLTLTLRDLQGNVLTGRTVAYASANTSVATVSVNGLVTAVSAGSATISATSEGKSGSLGFTVKSVSTQSVGTVTVQLASSTVTVSQGTQATAVVLDPTGHQAADQSVSWSSSASTVASVSSTGYASALAAGSALITATAGGKSGSAALTVQSAAPPPPAQTLSSVSVNLNSPSITVGQSTQAVAAALDANGGSINGATCNWSISPTSVATLGASTGSSVPATGASAGTATASATCTYNAVSKSGSAQLSVANATAATPPDLPALPTSFTVSYPTKTGTTRTVNAGGDLQAAINAATCGDEIVLQAGAMFVGPFTFPAKNCSGWIAVRSSQLANLPADVRVTPASASSMATLGAADPSGAIHMASGAHNWWLAGLNITIAPNYQYSLMYTLVWFGDNVETNAAQQPTDIVLDRSWVHSTAALGAQNGIEMNGARQAVLNSYCSDIYNPGVESHCLVAFGGSGPYLVQNNTFGAGMLPVLFGGAPSNIPNLVQSNIVFRKNYVYRPDSYYPSKPVKNLFEIKSATRVLIEDNVFEGAWESAHVGFCWHIIPMGDSGPWATVTDVTARRNICRKVGAGLNLSAWQNGATIPLNRVLIEDMIFEDVNDTYKGQARMIQLLNPMLNVTIRRISGPGTNLGQAILVSSASPLQNISITNNALEHGMYGFFRDGGAAFLGGFTNSLFSPNAIFSGAGGLDWPVGTGLFSTLAAAEQAGYGANRSAVIAGTNGVVIP